MANWHAVPDRQRKVELNLRIETNMNAAELGELVDGLCISLVDFGMERISDQRREYVHMRVLDPGGFHALD